jgi:ribosomal protein S18 acetylase RimI-like enzyme
MAVTIRELGESDVEALQDLIESVPDYAERITGYPPGPSDALSALISVPPGYDPAGKHGVGLWDDGELVAFADVLFGYPTPDAAYIGLLLVRAGRQRRGFGTALHDALLDRLREAGQVARVRLGVIETNASVAEPFWRALGYAPTGERKPYRYDKLTSTVALWERPVEPR